MSGTHSPEAEQPAHSPAPKGPHNRITSNVLNPNINSGGDAPVPDQTINLLNLLKFDQSKQPSANIQQPSVPSDCPSAGQDSRGGQPERQGRATWASDLMAQFIPRPPSSVAIQAQSNTVSSPEKSDLVRHVSSETKQKPQDVLLQLLNQGKPTQSINLKLKRQPTPVESSAPSVRDDVDDKVRDQSDALAEQADADKEKECDTSSIRIFGSEPPTTSVFTAPSSSSKDPVFTYVNPFEQLSAMPLHKLHPKSDTHSGTESPGAGVLKHERDTSSAREDEGDTSNFGPAPKTRKFTSALTKFTDTPTSVNDKPTGSSLSSEHCFTKVQKSPGGSEKSVDKELVTHLEKSNDEDGHLPQIRNGDMQPSDRKDPHIKSPTLDADRSDNIVRQQTLDEKTLSPKTDVQQESTDNHAQGILDSWESADPDENLKKEDKRTVRVFNFPLKPFVSINILKLDEPPTPIRAGAITDIARLKKDFDQIDRCLVAASSRSIVYAIAKTGGFRIIRQVSGQNRQVFQSSKERIFNVAISCVAPTRWTMDNEAVIATGVDGTVFWTSTSRYNSEAFPEENLERLSVKFPLVSPKDEAASNGTPKTRAKRSSRHTEFFGLGRGKMIYIVCPRHAMEPKYTNLYSRNCNTQKYFNEGCLKINTDKAGKDFTFSEDDSMIVSLDKAGRMKFWDIQDHVDAILKSRTGFISLEVKRPLMTLTTTSASTKSRPTSIIFLDKDRPYMKGSALRYLLIGKKQNHSLQLWDLGLGRPVQEINLPHEQELDAICSIAYHPLSGILAVGHPTRNSIYFFYFSAPRYNLPPMTQAKYVRMLVEKNDSLPKTNATAIMSGVREFSFASKGALRSLEMLSTRNMSSSADYRESSPLVFELYLMCSKGVTSVAVKREDLGWDKDSRVLRPIDALSEGAITVNPIKLSTNPASSETSYNGEAPEVGSTIPNISATGESFRKEAGTYSRCSQTQAPIIGPSGGKVDENQNAVQETAINGFEKLEKKNTDHMAAKDNVSQSHTDSKQSPRISPAFHLLQPNFVPQVASAQGIPQYSSSIEGGKSSLDGVSKLPNKSNNETCLNPMSISDMDLKRIVESASSGFSEVLSREIKTLYERFEEAKVMQEAAGTDKLDAVLRSFSSTLSDNLEKDLTEVVTKGLQATILPSLSESLSGDIDRRLSKNIIQSCSTIIPGEIKETVSRVISMTLKEPEVLGRLCDIISSKFLSHFDDQIISNFHKKIVPAFSDITKKSVQDLFNSLDRRIEELHRWSESQRQSDSFKIDQLTEVIRELSTTVQAIADGQCEVQRRFGNLQMKLDMARPRSADSQSGRPSESLQLKSPEEREIELIANMMQIGNFHEGSLMWAKSSRQAELFDQLFVQYNPNFVLEISPLLVLSIAIAVTDKFDTNISGRLFWLEFILTNVNHRNQEVVDVCPKIMEVLAQRLQGAYMEIAESNPTTSILRKISALTRRANDIKAMALQNSMSRT